MDKELIADYSDKIAKWTLVALVFLLPLIMNPWGYEKYEVSKLAFFHLATLILFAVWVVKSGEENELHLSGAPVGLPVLCLGLAVVASTVFSIHPPTSIYGGFARYEGLLTILNYFLIFYLTLLYFSPKEEAAYHPLIRVLIVSAVLVSIYGIFQHFGFDFFQWLPRTDVARSFSTFGNAVFLGAFLSLALPIILAEILRSDSLAETTLLGGALVLVGICLIFTYSRAAWLGTSLAVIIIIAYGYQIMWQKKQVLLVLSIAIAAIIIFSSLPGQTSTVKTYSTMDRSTSAFEAEEETVRNRLAIWQNCPSIIRTRPLIGFGPDTFQFVFSKYKSVKTARQFTESSIVDRAHNDLLQNATTQGLLGLLFYLWFLITFFWKGFVHLRKTSNPDSRWLQIGMLAATLSYVAQIQFSFSTVLVSPLFWLMVGLASSTWKNKDHVIRIPQSNTSRVAKCSLYLLLGTLAIFTLFLTVKVVAADTHANRGRISSMNSAYGEAIDQFERATALNASQGRYYFLLGSTYFKIAAASKPNSQPQTFWVDKAEQSLKVAIRLNPLDETPSITAASMYFNIGTLTKNRKMFEKASFYLKKALEVHPNNHKTHFKLGIIYAQQGKLDEAIGEWKKTVLLEPFFGNAYYNLGQAYEQKGRYKKAESFYKKAAQLEPSNLKAKQSLDRIRNTKGEK